MQDSGVEVDLLTGSSEGEFAFRDERWLRDRLGEGLSRAIASAGIAAPLKTLGDSLVTTTADFCIGMYENFTSASFLGAEPANRSILAEKRYSLPMFLDIPIGALQTGSGYWLHFFYVGGQSDTSHVCTGSLFLHHMRPLSSVAYLGIARIANLALNTITSAENEWRAAVAARAQMRNLLDAAYAHDQKAILEHAVLEPLHDLEKAVTDPTEHVRGLLDTAIRSVTSYHDNLMFFLNAFKALESPSKSTGRQALDKGSIAELLDPRTLALDQHGSLPHIQFQPKDGLNVTLKVPNEAFRVILHLLVTNAIDAMREDELAVETQELQIRAELGEATVERYCEIIVWNSGTQFLQPVMREAGHAPLTMVIRKGHTGLGLYFVERLLELAGALPQEERLHFRLNNTGSPKGVEVRFSLPAEEVDK